MKSKFEANERETKLFFLIKNLYLLTQSNYFLSKQKKILYYIYRPPFLHSPPPLPPPQYTHIHPDNHSYLFSSSST